MNDEHKIKLSDLRPEDIVLPPRKKRVKSRFTNREQIIVKIDKFTKKAKAHREKQREFYLAESNIRNDARRFEDESLVHQANRKQEIGDAWGKKAERLETKILASLKRKLAEFDTQTIPGITDDKTVEGLP